MELYVHLGGGAWALLGKVAPPAMVVQECREGQPFVGQRGGPCDTKLRNLGSVSPGTLQLGELGWALWRSPLPLSYP